MPDYPPAPPPVIDPGLLVAALEAAGWVEAGNLDDGHVVMAPHGCVVIPLNRDDPMYERHMTATVRRLEHEFLLRPSVWEGAVAPPEMLP
jgi:hypothetical protein